MNINDKIIKEAEEKISRIDKKMHRIGRYFTHPL